MRKKQESNRSVFYRLIQPLLETRHLNSPDYVLLVTTLLILILGLLMLSSATSVIAFESSLDSYTFVRQQLLHGVLPGIILFLFAIRINYKFYKKMHWLFLALTIFLLLLVFIPGIGVVNNGVRSWISIGTITVQTSEIAKLTFILWFSSWLASHKRKIKNFRNTTIPFIIIISLISTLLIMQPD